MKTIKTFEIALFVIILIFSSFVFVLDGKNEEMDNNFSLEDGFVAYWSFDEGEGNTAHDSSGNDNHGTIYGASWTTGISCSALEFDGNDGVWIDDDLTLDGFSSLTISVWAKPYNHKSGNMGYIIGKYQAHQSINCPYRIWAYEGDWIVELGDGSDCYIAKSPIFADDQWYHLVLWWDGAELKIYVDGAEVNSTDANTTLYDNNEYLRFGERVNDGYFNGIIDEVRIYNRALNNYEILNIYNETNNGNLSFNWLFPSSNEDFEIEMYEPYTISLEVINNGPNYHNFTYGINYSLSKYYNIFGMEISPYWETNEKSICYLDENYYNFNTYINDSIGPYHTKKHEFRIISNWNWLPEEHIVDIYKDILLQGLSELSTIKEGIEFLEVITQLLFESAPTAEFSCNVIGDLGYYYNESIKIWTSEEKNTALACSMFNSVLADFDTILGVKALPITFGASALAFIAEAAIMASSQDLYLKASDPDLNFSKFENPCPPYFPAIENLSGTHEDVALLCIYQPCYSNVFTKSYAKYLGALENNSKYWAGIQLALTKYFIEQYANISKIIYSSLETIFPEFPPLTLENITEIRNYLFTNGLPEIEKNLLKYHGFSDDTIDKILQRLLTMNDEYYFEAIDSFPQKYKNFSMIVDNLVNSIAKPQDDLLIVNLELENSHIDKISPPLEINCYLEFENISNLSGYQISSISLLNQIQPAYISQLPDDYDNDGFQDFLVRFNMSELLSLIVEGNNLFIITGNITNPLSESFYLAGASSLQFNGESPNVPGKPLGNISVNPYVNLTLTTSSFDPENSGIYYRFDWGDGNISNWFGPYKSGENCIVNHLWIYCGEYLIQAQAMDIWGHKTGWSDSLNVIVNNAPVANANGPYSGPEGLPVILDATGSYDPDGDPLQYFWDLDDDGFFDDSTDIMPSAIWCDDYVGTVTLKVADWHCNDTDSSKIKIFNVAPTVNAGSDTTILMKNAIERIGVITDPGCDKWEIKIDYGDDSPSLTYLNQTVKIFDIFHEYNSTGEYIVKVDVKDDDDGYGSDTILVYVICLSEVWVDDNWFCQADVDKYDPSLTWQWDAWNSIQDAVDVVCEGGIVHVLNGIYWEVNDILLYKQDVQITGVNQPPFDVTYNTAAVVYTPMIVTADGICIQQFAFMPEPGVPSITVDINLDADTARTNIVKINHNKFMRGCEGDAVAIENKAYGIVDACFNWWGAMDGPSGNVVDPCTGRVAEGFGASIVDNGPVHFDPWAGLDACGNIRLIRRLMIFDGSCSFAYHLDGTTNTNIEYLWNFGDKHYSHDKSGAHLYINPGVYTVTLRIKASDPDLHHTFMYDWENFKIVVK